MLEHTRESFVTTFDHGCGVVDQRQRSESQQVLRHAPDFFQSVWPAQHVDQYVIVDDATPFQLVEEAQIDVEVVDDGDDRLLNNGLVVRFRFSERCRRLRLGSSHRYDFNRCIQV